MGSKFSKPPGDVKSMVDMLPDLIGCDAKGSVLCQDNDTTLTCLNGGVCALYLKEVEDACEKRCKCSSDYIGNHCEFYNGFFTATVTIMVGCLLAVIFTVFFIILVWYCCSRKSRKGKDANDMEHTRAKRIPLADRVRHSLKLGNFDEEQHRSKKTEAGQTQVHYSLDSGTQDTDMPIGFSSRSYSLYDNIHMDPEEEVLRHTVRYEGEQYAPSNNGTRETAHLLATDEVDAGRQYQRSKQGDNDQLLIRMDQICPDAEPKIR